MRRSLRIVALVAALPVWTAGVVVWDDGTWVGVVLVLGAALLVTLGLGGAVATWLGGLTGAEAGWGVHGDAVHRGRPRPGPIVRGPEEDLVLVVPGPVGESAHLDRVLSRTSVAAVLAAAASVAAVLATDVPTWLVAVAPAAVLALGFAALVVAHASWLIGRRRRPGAVDAGFLADLRGTSAVELARWRLDVESGRTWTARSGTAPDHLVPAITWAQGRLRETGAETVGGLPEEDVLRLAASMSLEPVWRVVPVTGPEAEVDGAPRRPVEVRRVDEAPAAVPVPLGRQRGRVEPRAVLEPPRPRVEVVVPPPARPPVRGRPRGPRGEETTGP